MNTHSGILHSRQRRSVTIFFSHAFAQWKSVQNLTFVRAHSFIPRIPRSFTPWTKERGTVPKIIWRTIFMKILLEILPLVTLWTWTAGSLALTWQKQLVWYIREYAAPTSNLNILALLTICILFTNLTNKSGDQVSSFWWKTRDKESHASAHCTFKTVFSTSKFSPPRRCVHFPQM